MTGVATALSFIVVTLLTVVFSELLPKALTLRHAEAAASLTARVVLAIRQAVGPLVWVMNKLANARPPRAISFTWPVSSSDV